MGFRVVGAVKSVIGIVFSFREVMKLIPLVLLSSALVCCAKNQRISTEEQSVSNVKMQTPKYDVISVSDADWTYYSNVCGVDIINRSLVEPSGGQELSRKYERMKEDYDRNFQVDRECGNGKDLRTLNANDMIEELRVKLDCLRKSTSRPPRISRATSISSTTEIDRYKNAFTSDLFDRADSTMIRQGHLLTKPGHLSIRLSVQVDSSGQLYKVERLKPSGNNLFDYFISKTVCDMQPLKPFDEQLKSRVDLLDLVFSIRYMPNK